MSDAQLTCSWICDSCGELIENAEIGWVEWVEFENSLGQWRGRDLRLVHNYKDTMSQKSSCHLVSEREFQRDRGIISDLPLTHLLGHDGLMYLLLLLDEGRLPQEAILEMIKRLHIPGYERARKHFAEARSEDVFESILPEGFYQQRDIDAVIEWLNERDE